MGNGEGGILHLKVLHLSANILNYTQLFYFQTLIDLVQQNVSQAFLQNPPY